MKIKRLLAIAASLVLAQATCLPAFAQQYPTRTIRYIVPWPPGGGTDAVARILANKAGELLGQQIIVDNRGGAGTIIGMDAAAKAAPDGYNFGFPTQSFAVNATLQPTLPYNTVKDFEPVALLGTGTYVLVVNANFEPKTVEELIAKMKKEPDVVNAGFTGYGSPSHLGLLQFQRAAGVKATDVNYKGTGPAVTGLMGGEIQMMFTTLAGVLANVKSGRLRVLAVTSEARSELLPQTPTAIEAGLPNFVVYEWYGLNAPKGTKREQIDIMNAALQKVLVMPDVVERMRAIGAEPVTGSNPEKFGAFVDAEIAKWGKLVREENLKPE
ncbi:tripartite tricarboxylate transporter substrate binding protein [Aquabacter sp. CN5-332]|uniref:Bug family tripartite tricarboxylate transporter substrate binding protein n=1 Tax=Aquabacter sp. CN5-332 TaxID=3156608 RepID=UPI0032B50A65